MIRNLLMVEKERKQFNPMYTRLAVKLQWLRFIVYGYAVGCMGGLAIFISNLFYPSIVPTINIISISYFFLFFFVIFYDTITHKPFETDPKLKAFQEPNREMQTLMDKVNEMLKEKQLYLDPELTLLQIALAINEKERDVSQAINTIQKRNVKDYVNILRTEHACNLLLTEKDKPIFEVMYESGFNTKGAFNLAFKKITGKTPTSYRDKMS